MITNYLLKHKTIVDELCVVRHFIDKSDKVTHILDFLSEEYDPVVMNVTATNQNVSILVAYVYGHLLNMEIRLFRHQSSAS